MLDTGEDVRLKDYLERIGSPDKPIVVRSGDANWVAPTSLPVEALRLLVAEYARQYDVRGYIGRATTEDDQDGNQWTVQTMEEQLDRDGKVVRPRFIRLTCERGHYKLLDAQARLRLAQSKLAAAATHLKGTKQIQVRPGDFDGAKRKQDLLDRYGLEVSAATAECESLQAVIDGAEPLHYIFPLDLSKVQWLVAVDDADLRL